MSDNNSKIQSSSAGLSGLRATMAKLNLSPLACIGLALLAIVPLVITDDSMVRILVSALMYGGFAMAFDFTAGYINIANFGFTAFWGLGAYTSGIFLMKLGISPWVGMLAGALVAGIVGLLVGVLTIRLGGIFAACMTWFVALGLYAVARNLVDLTGGASGLTVGPLFEGTKNTGYYFVILAIVIIEYLVLSGVINSKSGLAFKAIGQDVEAAQASGISPTKYKVLNFAISCAFGGLIGGYYAHVSGIVIPKVIHTSNTIEIMALSFIGGRGTLWGSILCAMILMPLMEQLKSVSFLRDAMQVRLIIYGALLVIAMIVYPKGLAGIVEWLKGAFKKFTNKKSV